MDAYQLAGECLYVFALLPRDIKGASKRTSIEKVLSWSSDPVPIPADLATVLGRGLLNGGLAFKTLKPFQLGTLVEFARRWKALPPPERDVALEDPWNFRSFLQEVPVGSGYAMREGILHLVFPDAFEDIISRDHKAMIANAFSDRVTEPEADVDRKLLLIRQSLTPEREGWFSFYDPDLRYRWMPGKHEPEKWDAFVHWANRFAQSIDVDAEERDYKLDIGNRLREARGKVRIDDPHWIATLRAAFKRGNNIVHYVDTSRLFEWIEAHAVDARTVLLAAWEGDGHMGTRLDALAKASKQADFNFLTVASVLMMGVDASRYPPLRASALSKAFELTGEEPPQGSAEVKRYLTGLSFLQRFIDEARSRGLDLRDPLDAQALMWSVTSVDPPPSWRDEERTKFLSWRDRAEAPNGGTPPPVVHPPPGPKDIADLARSLYLPEAFLQDVLGLLQRKKQVVLYGPPGTGKTYIARALARYLAPERHEVVQLHPSYGYEDFVWGYRPQLREQVLTYELVPGPFKRLADAARSDPQPRVLIIDEINRGNLPRIFGELLYLLEYRNDDVELMYSEPGAERFRLPDNVLIIGTMNTADRSVGLIDAALRRRFHFIQLFPRRYPLDDSLTLWLKENKPGMLYVADVVDLLNERVERRLSPHLQVGHSHFFREDLSEEALDEIWRHDVMPFLEDQLFGHEEQLKEFELRTLLGEVGANDNADGVATEERSTDV